MPAFRERVADGWRTRPRASRWRAAVRRCSASTRRSAGASSAAARNPDASTSARSGRSHSARSRCTQCTRRCGCRRRTSTLDRTRRMLRRRGWTWEVWRRTRPTPPPRRVAFGCAAPSVAARYMAFGQDAGKWIRGGADRARALSEGVGVHGTLTRSGTDRHRRCRAPSKPGIWIEVLWNLSTSRCRACHRRGRRAVMGQTC
jgi:hypothetical protein